MPKTILRLPATLARSGHKRSTLYLHIKQGLWSKPVKIGPRAVGWPAYEADAINDARIRGASDAEIRKLVRQLEAERGALQGTWDD